MRSCILIIPQQLFKYNKCYYFDLIVQIFVLQISYKLKFTHMITFFLQQKKYVIDFDFNNQQTDIVAKLIETKSNKKITYREFTGI